MWQCSFYLLKRRREECLFHINLCQPWVKRLNKLCNNLHFTFNKLIFITLHKISSEFKFYSNLNFVPSRSGVKKFTLHWSKWEFVFSAESFLSNPEFASHWRQFDSALILVIFYSIVLLFEIILNEIYNFEYRLLNFLKTTMMVLMMMMMMMMMQQHNHKEWKMNKSLVNLNLKFLFVY